MGTGGAVESKWLVVCSGWVGGSGVSRPLHHNRRLVALHGLDESEVSKHLKVFNSALPLSYNVGSTDTL